LTLLLLAVVVDCSNDPLHQYRLELISCLISGKILGMEMSFSSSMNSVVCIKVQTLFEMIASRLSEDSNTSVKTTPSSALLLLGLLALFI
jgi:hypothetical protein